MSRRSNARSIAAFLDSMRSSARFPRGFVRVKNIRVLFYRTRRRCEVFPTFIFFLFLFPFLFPLADFVRVRYRICICVIWYSIYNKIRVPFISLVLFFFLLFSFPVFCFLPIHPVVSFALLVSFIASFYILLPLLFYSFFYFAGFPAAASFPSVVLFLFRRMQFLFNFNYITTCKKSQYRARFSRVNFTFKYKKIVQTFLKQSFSERLFLYKALFLCA